MNLHKKTSFLVVPAFAFFPSFSFLLVDERARNENLEHL